MALVIRYLRIALVFVGLVVVFRIGITYRATTTAENDTKMAPAVKQNARVIFNIRRYKPRDIAAGDVVIFIPPGGNDDDRSIARVAYVQGQEVGANGDAYRGVIVPRGHFFLLFEQAQFEGDSRTFGPIPYPYIEGKVVSPNTKKK